MANLEDSLVDQMKAASGARPAAPASTAAPQMPVPKPSAGPKPMSVKAANTAKAAYASLLAPLEPIVNGTQRAAGTGVGTVFDLLNRPHEAVAAGLSSGSPLTALRTLAHGQSQESQDTTRAVMRRQMGMDGSEPSPLFRAAGARAMPKGLRYQDLPQWQRGLVDLEVDTALDPLTYAGGVGALDELFAKAGIRGIPAISRAIDAASRSNNPSVRKGAKIAAGIYDFTHYKGSSQRALASRSGAEGVGHFSALKSINNARRSTQTDLGNELVGQYHDVVKGLHPAQEMQLYEAIHNGTVASLPPNLAMRAAAFKRVTDSLAHLSGDESLQKALEYGFEHHGPTGATTAGGGFKLPQGLNRFVAEKPRALQHADEYRQNYIPTAHDMRRFTAQQVERGIASLDKTTEEPLGSLEEILSAPNEPGDRTSLTQGVKAEDKFLKERGDHARLAETPELQRKVVEARLKSGANAIAARDAERRVSELFGAGSFKNVPRDAQEFFRETYTTPENKQWWQHLADGWKGAIDIPKIGLFALPFRHMANISTLAFMADPGIAGTAASKYVRLMLAGTNAEKRSKILGDAVKYGVSRTPSIDRKAAAGWLGKVPGIGEIYKASNNALWTFDDAVKATRFQRLVKRYKSRGMDATKAAYKAADDVGAELIDYSNRSPLTQALSYVAPFASYRSRFPVAVARTVTRHPERVLAAGRASPELVGDEQVAAPNAKGQPQVGKSYLPLPDTLRGVDNPWSFARSTAGYPLQMALSQIGVHGDDYPNYFTYGKPPDLKYAANATLGSFPGGSLGLNALGQGEFANQGDPGGALRGQTGFSLTRAPSLRDLQHARHITLLKEAIQAARQGGDATTAAAYEKRLRAYMQFNHIFEK